MRYTVKGLFLKSGDSVLVSPTDLQKYNSENIGSLTVDKDSTTINQFDNKADGVIYIETKHFSRKRFLNYFKSKSSKFSQLMDSLQSDENFQ
jgi:hypothetical protein